MGRINLKGVILGGLVTGVVLVAYDFLMYGVVLRAEFEAAMQPSARRRTRTRSTCTWCWI
jgi:hypothetical protein